MIRDSVKYEAIVMGASAGGMHAVRTILQPLPRNFPLPVVIVQHREKNEKTMLEETLQYHCKIKVKQADEKEKPEQGTAYIAPANYHLLIEHDKSFSLSVDNYHNYSRPSIDILFETAAEVYNQHLIGIVLTGANADGAQGLKRIACNGGFTIVQEPGSAEFPAMPEAATRLYGTHKIMDLTSIVAFLFNLNDSLFTKTDLRT